MCVCAKSLQWPTLGDPMDCQAPLSTGFSKQEEWSGLPRPPQSMIYPVLYYFINMSIFAIQVFTQKERHLFSMDLYFLQNDILKE